MEPELLERLVATEQREKSNSHRIGDLEKEQAGIKELIKAVTELAAEMRCMRDTQDDISGRIKAIEDRPAARMEQVVSAVIVAVVGICIGYLFGGVM